MIKSVRYPVGLPVFIYYETEPETRDPTSYSISFCNRTLDALASGEQEQNMRVGLGLLLV